MHQPEVLSEEEEEEEEDDKGEAERGEGSSQQPGMELASSSDSSRYYESFKFSML